MKNQISEKKIISSIYLRKVSKYPIMILLLLLMTSCASVFRGSKTSKVISISGTPNESNVYVDNQLVGKSPVNYEVKKKKEHLVRIEKEGYKDSNAKIETKLNPLWTGISFAGNLLLFELPTIYDFKSGAVKDLKTDAITFNLEKTDSKNQSEKAKSDVISKNQVSSTNNENSENIFNPAVRVRTQTEEYFLKYRTALTVTTKSGLRVASNIKEIKPDYFVLAKKNTKIYYSDIKKIRVFPSRRWFPTLTIFSVVSPVMWYVNSKVVKVNSSNCKKNILEITVVNKFNEHNYGKVKCF